MTSTEDRIACPTPDKYRYATLELAEKDALRLSAGRGRKLTVYDDCPCGWVHLAKERPPRGIGADPMTTAEIILLSQDDFNKLVRNEVRGNVHPDTAKALRDGALTQAWSAALRLFQMDMNIQKQHKGGDKSAAVTEWRRRIDRVVLSARDRQAEIKSITTLKEQRDRLAATGTLDQALRSDEELDAEILKMLAAELAFKKLKRIHHDEFLHLLMAEYERFGIPLTKAMTRALERDSDD